MSFKPSLKLDWCSHEAAKYAVEKWHYSGSIPVGKLVKIGAWEDKKYIGCVLFGRGANRNAGSPYGLQTTEIAELVRVALSKHQTPVSRIIAIAIRFLQKQSKGLRLIFSYADPEEGHHGGIYQAGGWVYVGSSVPQSAVLLNGKVVHKRTAHSFIGTISGLEKSKVTWKHKYLMPLDAEMRERITPLAKPYPKRVRSVAGDTPGVQPGMGGSIPTRTLSIIPEAEGLTVEKIG